MYRECPAGGPGAHRVSALGRGGFLRTPRQAGLRVYKPSACCLSQLLLASGVLVFPGRRQPKSESGICYIYENIKAAQVTPCPSLPSRFVSRAACSLSALPLCLSPYCLGCPSILVLPACFRCRNAILVSRKCNAKTQRGGSGKIKFVYVIKRLCRLARGYEPPTSRLQAAVIRRLVDLGWSPVISSAGVLFSSSPGRLVEWRYSRDSCCGYICLR